MKELLAYLEEGKLDNAELLKFYELLGTNASLKRTMATSKKTLDTHIRYNIWKLLPSDEKAKYSQDLQPIQAKTDLKEPEKDLKEAKTDSKEPETDSKEPETDLNEPEKDLKEAKTDSKEPETDSKEPETDLNEPENRGIDDKKKA
jgi:hypothetical protein